MSTDRQVKLLKVICAGAFPVLVVLGSELDKRGYWPWHNAAFLGAVLSGAVWFVLREKDLSRYRGRRMAVRTGVCIAFLPFLMARPPGGGLADIWYGDVALLAMIVALGVTAFRRAYSLRARQLRD